MLFDSWGERTCVRYSKNGTIVKLYKKRSKVAADSSHIIYNVQPDLLECMWDSNSNFKGMIVLFWLKRVLTKEFSK